MFRAIDHGDHVSVKGPYLFTEFRPMRALEDVKVRYPTPKVDVTSPLIDSLQLLAQDQEGAPCNFGVRSYKDRRVSGIPWKFHLKHPTILFIWIVEVLWKLLRSPIGVFLYESMDGWSVASILPLRVKCQANQLVILHGLLYVKFWRVHKSTLNYNERCAVDLVRVEQRPPLNTSKDCISQPNENSCNFKDNFPPWRTVVLALAGIWCITWGWWNLRNERWLIWATLAFVGGCILWLYGFGSLIMWWGDRI
jgi:hypothetical protein